MFIFICILFFVVSIYFAVFFFFLMLRRPPRSTRTDTLFPYTTLFRSIRRCRAAQPERPATGQQGPARACAFPRCGSTKWSCVLRRWHPPCRPGLLRSCNRFHRVLVTVSMRAAQGVGMLCRRAVAFVRSEERRVGKECVRTCKSRGWRY